MTTEPTPLDSAIEALEFGRIAKNDAGDVLMWDGKAWIKPQRSAQDKLGRMAYNIGDKWTVDPDTEPGTAKRMAAIVGPSVGEGTKQFLNIPRDALVAAVRNAPEILEFLTNPGMTGTRIAGMAPPIDEGVKKELGGVAQKIEKTLDVGNTFSALGIPHESITTEPKNAVERMLQTTARMAGSQVPLAGVMSGVTRTPLAPHLQQAGLISAGTAPGEEVAGPEGGMITGIVSSILGGRVLNARAARRADPAPLREALQREAAAAYDETARAGVVFKPGSIHQMIGGMANDMSRQGLNISSKASTNLYPQATNSLKLASDALVGPLTFENAEILRRNFNTAQKAAVAAKNFDDARLVSRLKTRLDRFVGSATQNDVLAGNPQMAAKSIKEARYAYSRAAKAETLEDLVERATTTGRSLPGGIDQALRGEFRNLTRRKREFRLFTPEERDAIRAVPEGNLTSNVLSTIGRFAFRGPFTGAIHGGIGVGTGAEMAAGSLAAGEVGRALGTAATRGRVDAASELIRRGRPMMPLRKTEEELIGLLVQRALGARSEAESPIGGSPSEQ